MSLSTNAFRIYDRICPAPLKLRVLNIDDSPVTIKSIRSIIDKAYENGWIVPEIVIMVIKICVGSVQQGWQHHNNGKRAIM